MPDTDQVERNKPTVYASVAVGRNSYWNLPQGRLAFWPFRHKSVKGKRLLRGQ